MTAHQNGPRPESEVPAPQREPAPTTTTTVDVATISHRCRECGKRLGAPKTVKRGMCRSCWRVHKVVTA